MDNREWLLSNAFAEYRLEEIKAGAEFFKNVLTNPHDTQYLRGVSDMLRAIIKLPMSIAASKEEKETAEAMTAAAFKQVEMSVLRSIVMGEG